MKLKITLAAAAVALVAVPHGVAAPGPADPAAKLARHLAQAECKMERRAMGNAGFRAEYGARPRRACLEAKAEAAAAAVAAAVEECRGSAEAPAGEPAQGGGARNAARRCVREKVRALLAEARAELRNAAQECKAEREADPDAFRTKYGTNENGRNAFVKCVSSKAGDGAPEDGQEGAAPAPAAPQPPS